MKKYKAVGINIYGGGFTLGVMKHFHVLGQWEETTLGKRTFAMNFPKLYRPLNLSEWPIEAHVGKVHLVYANPPCAPWSMANNHAGKTKASRFLDIRLNLTAHTYEAAIRLRPEVFISESVESGYTTGVSYYDQYVDLWMKAGYAVTFFLSDAILQGAPCARRRFHFIAHRSKLQLGKPPKIIKAMTVENAIGDLRKINGQVSLHNERPLDKSILELVKVTKPGETLRECYHRIKGGYKGQRVGFFVKRLKWDRPAFTMVRFDYIHPIDDRWITFREAMRLCTYPDTFMAASAVEAVDAVLPVVGEFLAKVARKTIVENKPCPVEFNFIDWRPLGKPFHINAKERV